MIVNIGAMFYNIDMAFKRRIFCVFICVLFFLHFNLFSDSSTLYGRNLCDAVYNFLLNNQANPERSSLISEGSNSFPYNIVCNFKSSGEVSNFSAEERNTLLFAFTQQDALKYADVIFDLVSNLNSYKRNFDVLLLFSYGDSDIEESISGTKIYSSEYGNPDDVAAICVSFNGKEKTHITPGGASDSAPKWLVSYSMESISEQNIDFEVDGDIFTSLYSLGLLQSDSRTSYFLSAEIPAVGIEFSTDIENSKTSSVLKKIASSYKSEDSTQWERHYIPLKISNNFILVGERPIVIIFIAVAFSAFGFLFLNSFFSRKRKKVAWETLRLVYALVITIAVSVLALQLGQRFSEFIKIGSISIYYAFAIKILFSFLGVIFLLDINTRILFFISDTKYWFLISLVAVINLFLFSVIDISFFLIFGVELFILYFSRMFHGTVKLIFVSILLAVPFFPFIYQLARFSNTSVLESLVFSTVLENFLLAIVLFPMQFQWLRVISSWYGKMESIPKTNIVRRQLFLFILPIILFTAVIYAGGIVTQSFFKSEKNNTISEVRTTSDDIIKIDVQDVTFFGETFRTLKVDLGNEPFACEVSIKGETALPIIYSENEYNTDMANLSTEFLVPSYPPKNLLFRYIIGADENSLITVTAKYYNPDNKIMTLREKELTVAKKRS